MCIRDSLSPPSAFHGRPLHSRINRAAPNHQHQTTKPPLASQGAAPGSFKRFSAKTKHADKHRQNRMRAPTSA
eukprot:824332-Alexandrium_andersonii.AAC.1